MLSVSRLFDVALLALVAWGLCLGLIRWRAPLQRGRARFAWGACASVWFACWWLSTPVVSLALVRGLEGADGMSPSLDAPSLRERTAIVVLSSSIQPPAPGVSLIERLDTEGTARTLGAARVWRELRSRRVIVTGRAPGSVYDENVRAMAELLVTQGVPRERVALEPWALNTRQNAELSVRLGMSLGCDRFVVVTSALHMPRALREFRRAGAAALPAPVHRVSDRYGVAGDWLPVSWGLSATNAAVHEYLGMLKP